MDPMDQKLHDRITHIYDQYMDVREQLEGVKPLLETERKLRTELFNLLVPNPEEGTTRVDAPDGKLLEFNYGFNRKVDEAAFDVIQRDLLQDGIDIRGALRYKPEVDLKYYRKLDPALQHKVDQALTVTPKTPSLTVKD